MLYQNIENLPLAPLGTSTQLFDFDALPPTTASGYTSVLPTTLYDPAGTYPDPERKYQHTTYGWDVPLVSGGQSTQGAFDRGVGSSPVYDQLLRDGHLAHDAHHFRADVAAGWYLVSAKLGDRTIGAGPDADHGRVHQRGAGRSAVHGGGAVRVGVVRGAGAAAASRWTWCSATWAGSRTGC